MTTNSSDAGSPTPDNNTLPSEKGQVEHVDDPVSNALTQGIDVEELPPGYFTSSKFIG
jgi:hypothetical protein